MREENEMTGIRSELQLGFQMCRPRPPDQPHMQTDAMPSANHVLSPPPTPAAVPIFPAAGAASPDEEHSLQRARWPEVQVRAPGSKPISVLAQDSRHFLHHPEAGSRQKPTPTAGNCSGGPGEGVQPLLPEGALEGNGNYLGPSQRPVA